MRSFCLVSLVCIAACGGSNNGTNGDAGAPPIDGLVSIEVQPATQTLTIANGKAASSVYIATGHFQDGHVADISSRVSWSVDDTSLASFAGTMLTTDTVHGGKTNVRATAGTVGGLANLSVKLIAAWNDPSTSDLGAGVDPSTRFGGSADPSRNPDLVYPNDGVLVPPNLGLLEIHFLPGNNNTLFALHYKNDVTDVTVYTRCTEPTNGGCIYTPDPQVWEWVAETNRGADPVAITATGTDDAGSAVGTSDPTHVSFSYDDIEGGFYYWTTSNGTGIMRFDFASPTQTTAEQFLDTSLTGGTCVGCHALSRDGAKLVAEAGGQNDGRLLMLDVGTKTPIVPFAQPDKSIFESWNPDGSQFAGVYGDSGASNYNLMILDGTTGMTTQTVDVGGDSNHPTDHPDWSPDGQSIAYVRVGVANTLQKMHGGEIQMVTKDSTGVWGSPQVLVPGVADKNHYYPAFSPDGSVIVYDESTCPSGQNGSKLCNADTDPSAKMWVVPPTTGATPVELANADAPGKQDNGNTDVTDSFPKWCPFVFQRTGEFGSKLIWVTFSSTRMYGLRTPPAGGDENPSGTLLWMAAIDPDKVGTGEDPSYVAFALPFQDLTTSNHIAQWTTKVVPIIK